MGLDLINVMRGRVHRPMKAAHRSQPSKSEYRLAKQNSGHRCLGRGSSYAVQALLSVGGRVRGESSGTSGTPVRGSEGDDHTIVPMVAEVLAIFAGALTLLGNMAVALLDDDSSLNQEQKKANDDLALEQAKAKYNLVLQAMATNDAAIAKRNIHFFIDAGLLPGPGLAKSATRLIRTSRSCRLLSGVAPATPPASIPLPRLPRFTTFRAETSKSLNLPAPDVAPVYVDGASSNPDPGTASAATNALSASAAGVTKRALCAGR